MTQGFTFHLARGGRVPWLSLKSSVLHIVLNKGITLTSKCSAVLHLLSMAVQFTKGVLEKLISDSYLNCLIMPL